MPDTKLTRSEENIFQQWRKSLPKNLQSDDATYDLRGAWKGGLEPVFVQGEWHLGSRNPESGKLLKSPNHPTYDKMIEGEIKAGYTPTIDLNSGQMRSFKDNQMYKKKSNYFLGGPLLGQLAGMGVNLLDNALKESAVPAQIDSTSFYRGGDTKLSNSATQIGGSSGVDTNRRIVDGRNVNLTKGEIVDNSYVFSNAPDMKVPGTDSTFAEFVKPFMRTDSKLEYRLARNPKDKISQRTLEMNQGFKNSLKEMEKVERNKREPQPALNKNLGGFISPLLAQLMGGAAKRMNDPANKPLDILSTKNSVFMPERLQTMLDNRNRPASATPTQVDPTLLGASLSNVGSNIQSAGASALAQEPEGKRLPLTPGDISYLGAKGIELLGKANAAFAPAQQVSSSPFEIDPQRVSATPALAQTNTAFRSGIQRVNTGSANLDRAVKASLFSEKMKTDATSVLGAQQSNRQAKLSTDQYNSQVRQRVEEMNTKAVAARQAGIDNVLSSIGTLGQISQDAVNTNIGNEMKLETLNSMSQYYGINLEELIRMMKLNPKKFNQDFVQFKTQTQ